MASAYDDDPHELYLNDSAYGDEAHPPSLLPSSTTAQLADALYGEDVDRYDGASGQFSLAHELAAALMPEPNASAKSLADEFGLEFDEGDDNVAASLLHVPGSQLPVHARDPPPSQTLINGFSDIDTPHTPRQERLREQNTSPQINGFSQDALDIIATNVQRIDTFLARLNTMDSITSPSRALHTSPVEEVTTSLIKRMHEIAREREEQVRRFEAMSRELRKRMERHLQLPEIELVDGWLDSDAMEDIGIAGSRSSYPLATTLLGPISEASEGNIEHDDDDTGFFSPSDPDNQPNARVRGIAQSATGIAGLSELRAATASLVDALGAVSDQAQVNAAANAEAGRKLRALKNRVGDWWEEWESAERSKALIAQWQAGNFGSDPDYCEVPVLSSTSSSRDGSPMPMTPPHPLSPQRSSKARRIVEEELKGFSALVEQATCEAQALRSLCESSFRASS